MICGIVTLIKDEQDYLEEWIQYTLNKGFDKILIYEDIDSTSHKYICDKYSEVELHSILEIDSYENLNNLFRQIPLYTYITKIKPFDWCLFCDIDEYIKGNFDDIHDVCKWCENNNYYSINIYWNIATCSGHAWKPGNNLLNNYNDIITDYDTICNMCKSPQGNFSLKSFIQLKLFKKWLNIPHIAITNDIITIVGDKFKYKKFDFSNIKGHKTPFNIYLLHYMTKSYEEFVIIKLNKELANYGEHSSTNPSLAARTLEYFNLINKKYLKDNNFINQINQINKKYNLIYDKRNIK